MVASDGGYIIRYWWTPLAHAVPPRSQTRAFSRGEGRTMQDTCSRTVRMLASLLVVVVALTVSGATVTIDKSVTHQTMIGFGTHTNIKPWKAKIGPFYYTIDLDSVGFYDSLTRDMSVFRTGMRSGANEHIKAFVQRGIRHVIMTSWAPPADMKTNGETCCGGNLLDDKYDDYARHCVDQIKKFKQDCGLDLLAFNFQNEPAFYEPYNSCIFDPAAYKRMHVELGRLADSEGVLQNTMLMGPECMATYLRGDGVKNYTDPILNDSEAKGYLGALAVHGYKDGVEPDYGSADGWTRIATRANALGIPCWQTETDMPGATIGEALNMAGAMYVGVKFGDLTIFSKWTMCNSSDNALVWDGIYRPGYYALAHFGRYVRDGAVRVDCESTDAKVLALAFQDQARGWFTVILINNATANKSIEITGAGLPPSYQAFQTSGSQKGVEVGPLNPGSITLPPQSITTLYAGVTTSVSDEHLRINAPHVSHPALDAIGAVFDLRGRSCGPAAIELRAPGVYAKPRTDNSPRHRTHMRLRDR
ncbi:MAG: hypothetical protein GF331_18055 [Chitinivibrionales bacterium]|nr:hypothetical protein [Chitinivibrionales bacterium]